MITNEDISWLLKELEEGGGGGEEVVNYSPG
jgi:hypothetical protein